MEDAVYVERSVAFLGEALRGGCRTKKGNVIALVWHLAAPRLASRKFLEGKGDA